MNNKIQILIVEDEAIIAENLRYSLEDLGFEVIDTCYTFNEACNAISNKIFDLVMLDVNLGSADENQNGLGIAQILNQKSQIPFIFITAYNDFDTIKAAAKLQPYGYLIKPVNNTVLFAAIQMAIERFNNKIAATAPDNVQEKPEYFFVKIGSKTHKVFWKDVYCIEAGKNYVKLRCNLSGLMYPIRGSLSYVINNLLPAQFNSAFIKINRSNYLNKQYITGYDQYYVYCNGEKFEKVKTVSIN